MHKGELANINPPRITTEPKLFWRKEKIKKEKEQRLAPFPLI